MWNWWDIGTKDGADVWRHCETGFEVTSEIAGYRVSRRGEVIGDGMAWPAVVQLIESARQVNNQREDRG